MTMAAGGAFDSTGGRERCLSLALLGVSGVESLFSSGMSVSVASAVIWG